MALRLHQAIVALLELALMITSLTKAMVSTNKIGVFTHEPYPTPRHLQTTCSRMFSDVSPAACGKECLIRPGRCRFVAYDRFLRWCHVCSEWPSGYPQAEYLGTRRIAVSDISTWNKEIIGKCAKKPCSSTQSCQIESGQVTCVNENECDAPAVVPFANPSWCPHREVGDVIRYTCVAGRQSVGGLAPYSKCQKSGTWSKVEDPCTFPWECVPTDNKVNKARGRFTMQSTNYGTTVLSAKAVDGVKNQNYFAGHCSCTQDTSSDSWWLVDLAEGHCVDKIVIYNRGDCCGERLRNLNITVGMQLNGQFRPCTFFAGPGKNWEIWHISCDKPVFGRVVKLQIPPGILTLCEVEVY